MVYSDLSNATVTLCNIVTVQSFSSFESFCYDISQLVMIDLSLVASMQPVKVFYFLISGGGGNSRIQGWRERREQTEGLEGVDRCKDG